MIRRELQAKGVEREVATASVEPLDDRENAYRAGLRWLPALANADYDTFRRRMWGRLHRRGFAQALIRETVARLWEERGGGGDAAAVGLRRRPVETAHALRQAHGLTRN